MAAKKPPVRRKPGWKKGHVQRCASCGAMLAVVNGVTKCSNLACPTNTGSKGGRG